MIILSREKFEGVKRGIGSGRGFTLTELLVVAVITIIFAAMLLPALSRAVEQDGRAVCKSSLATLGKAVGMYAQDFDKFFPNGFKYTEDMAEVHPGHPNASWAEQLVPYAGGAEPFRCPDDAPGPFNRRRDATSSYSMNSALIARGLTAEAVSARMEDVKRPGRHMMFADDRHVPGRDYACHLIEHSRPFFDFNRMTNHSVRSKNLWPDDGPHSSGYWFSVDAGYLFDPALSLAFNRHDDGFNMAFVDGSVEWRQLNIEVTNIEGTEGTYTPFDDVDVRL